jgi:hypothetical protein
MNGAAALVPAVVVTLTSLLVACGGSKNAEASL